MIKPNDAIIIRRVANGYVVCPFGECNEVSAIELKTVVFQEKGGWCSTGDHQKEQDTLLGWINQHFPQCIE